MSWFAIYTRPKNEKKVTFSLEKMGIEAYCPMITQVKQWSDRKKKVENKAERLILCSFLPFRRICFNEISIRKIFTNKKR